MSKLSTKTGLLAVVILGSSIFLTQSVSADTTTSTPQQPPREMNMMMGEMDKNHDAIMEFLGIYNGRVTAVSGTTITIEGKNKTSMTVNASNATVMRDGKDSTVSTIAVDDMLIIRGDLSGATITASKIAAMPKPTKKAMTTVKKMMKDGFKDLKNGMKEKRQKPAPAPQANSMQN